VLLINDNYILYSNTQKRNYLQKSSLFCMFATLFEVLSAILILKNSFNMKNLVLALVATIGLFSFTTLKTSTYTVDTKVSTLEWLAKKVTGQHNGTIKISSGAFVVNKNKIESGDFTIDMKTIACSDLKGENAGKLLGHLNSDDFFSTEKNPTANLKIKKVTETKVAGTYDFVADLTIKGITNEITFPANVTMDAKLVKATADFMVNRTKYGIKYGSKSFFASIGDKAIYDDFNMKVNLVATK